MGEPRWEDLEHSDVLIVDMGDDGLAAFIEVGVGVHKTIYLWWRLRLVVEGNWVEQYIKVRGNLGLQDPLHGPIMPAPDRRGVLRSGVLTRMRLALG